MTVSESLLSSAERFHGITKVVSDAPLDPDVLRYARAEAESALQHFSSVRGVEILLAGDAGGPAICRLHVTFSSGFPVVVGHSSPAVRHAIDRAVETAAQIIEGRPSRS